MTLLRDKYLVIKCWRYIIAHVRQRDLLIKVFNQLSWSEVILCDYGRFIKFQFQLINCEIIKYVWQWEEFILLYKINYTIFELHYSLLKEPKLQKKSKQIQKTRCKNENKNLSWEMDYCYTLDSILQVFSRKRFDFSPQFGFFLFCFKVFWFFFLKTEQFL